MNVVLAVVLPLLVAYAPTLWWCVEMWLYDDGYYSHGFLVPLLMAAMFWWRRRQWQRQPAQPDWRGMLLLGPALLLHLCGVGLTIDSLSAASLVLAVPGAALLALGRQRLRGQWPLLWLPLFAVPLPLFVSGQVAFRLKEFAVGAGLAIANGTGLAAVRDGAVLRVPAMPAGDHGLLVADPCGGLRSLLAMLLLAYVIAFLVGPPQLRRRLLLLLLAVPIALLLNALRIAGVLWFAQWWGTEFAANSGHDLLNALAWVADLALVFGLDALLSRGAAAAATAPEPVAIEALPVPARRRGMAVLLWTLAPLLLLLGLYRPPASTRGRAEQLPVVLGGFRLQQSYPIPAQYYRLLGTDDATWRSYVDGSGGEVVVVAVFHDSNWKSVHPPHVCLQGSDFVLVEDDHVSIDLGGAPVPVGHLVAEASQSGRPYVCDYVFGSRDLVTGSYWSFFWHHAPRALFRRSNAGFLLRVESWADGDDGRAAAERRCRELLQQLLPAAQELLR